MDPEIQTEREKEREKGYNLLYLKPVIVYKDTEIYRQTKRDTETRDRYISYISNLRVFNC